MTNPALHLFAHCGFVINCAYQKFPSLLSLFLFLLSSLPSLLLLPPFSLSSSLSLPLLPPFSLFSLPFSFFSPLLLSSSFPLLSLFLPSLFSLPFSLFLSLFYLSPFSPAFLPPAAGRLGGHRASGDSALRVVESDCASAVPRPPRPLAALRHALRLGDRIR